MRENKEDFKKEGEITPEWLKTIQLNSWEAELLISALVLYALFQIPDLIRDFSYEIFEKGSSSFVLTRNLIKGIILLQIGYSAHIIVRGLWVASVGFSYVFPKGINKERLGFKGRFKKELSKSSSLVNNVLRLEELSSIIYGLTFTLFGVILSIGLLIFFYLLVMKFTSPYSPNSFFDSPTFFGIFSWIYALCVLLLFFDFISSGLFRRKEWAVDWFYPLALFFRFITFSFIYRRSFLVLMSNLKGWRARMVSLIIALLAVGFFKLGSFIGDIKKENYYEMIQRGNSIPSNYRDTYDEDDYFLCSIQSRVVGESFLNIILKDISAFEKMKDSPWARDEIKWNQHGSDSISYFLNQWFEVKVGDKQLKDIRWENTRHPVDHFYCFSAIVDLKDFERGGHKITIRGDTARMDKRAKKYWLDSEYNDRLLMNAPFFLDK